MTTINEIVRIWKLRTQTLCLTGQPIFMGIVNVTPDSFSDGGRYFETSAAVDHALQLVEAGAEILDIGGESTRPGSDGVGVEEELRRVIPVVTAIVDAMVSATPQNKRIPISVDTTKPCVAYESIQIGAEIINDVSPATDPAMLRVLLETGAGYCVMHSQGMPKTMQLNPQYDNVVAEVFEILQRRRNELINSGVEPERIAVDPGLGFGKTTEHNLELVENMERFHDLEAPLLVGHSRKKFITERFGNREIGTNLITKKLIEKRVSVIRLHEIPSREILGG
ncbi:MAG: dihydropteroate synthase [Planctomycetaceae bacterium]|jgi:dihydropteroate synthase|nr:dihydropteroate synthase [Planctomycetaceae bacterium]